MPQGGKNCMRILRSSARATNPRASARECSRPTPDEPTPGKALALHDGSYRTATTTTASKDPELSQFEMADVRRSPSTIIERRPSLSRFLR